MTTAALDDTGVPTATRQRILDAAVALCIRHSFAGTSLQMIADELGFTKAAIYYHFPVREQLVLAVMAPILQQIQGIVETAERQRGARSRAESMVRGYADVVARNRSVAAVLTSDPSVRGVLTDQPEWNDVIARQMALLAGLEPEHTGIMKATAVLTGLAGAAASAPVDLDEQTVCEQLVDVGRRVLGLRAPRNKVGIPTESRP
jgi:AcrR family transcriptional regulator